jgi:hypothetical protein
MQIIRAARDMDAGTELEFSYLGTSTGDPHDYRKTEKELNTWGFTCSCPLCKDAKYTSGEVLENRKRLYGSLKHTLEGHSSDGRRPNFIQSERLMLQLEETFVDDDSSIPMTGAWFHYLRLGNHYARILAQPHNAIRAILKGLEMLGFEIEGGDLMQQRGEKNDLTVKKWGMAAHEMMNGWVLLWTSFAFLGERDRAEQARKIAAVSYRILVGEDETFEESIGKDVRLSIKEKRLWGGFGLRSLSGQT